MDVLVGTNKLSSDGTRYKVKKIIKHDGFIFNDNSKANDIGALYVDGPIQFNEKVQPIKYSTKEVGDGENLQVTGWGLLDVSYFYVLFRIVVDVVYLCLTL